MLFLETRTSNNKSEFPCAQIVLLNWLTYFHIHMKQNVFKSLCKKRIKTLVVALNSIFRYIDDVLSINNSYFHSYINSIYLSKLDSTYFETSVSNLVILLEKDIKGNLTTKRYDDFNIQSSTSLTLLM